jgi:hypothetical protein
VKGLLINIIDVLGIFVPGFLLLIGILLFPPLANDLLKEWPTFTILLEAIRNNIWIVASLSVIASYVLGFLIRLCSIRILHTLTKRSWAEKLRLRTTVIEPTIKSALNDEELCKAIEANAKAERISSLAPYFHFAKRIVRSGPPVLWAESERMEADIRFAAGIFVPLLVFIVDGLWLWSLSGSVLAAISGVGAFVIIVTFPSRRIREVVYNYYLALIVLRYVAKLPASTRGDAA